MFDYLENDDQLGAPATQIDDDLGEPAGLGVSAVKQKRVQFDQAAYDQAVKDDAARTEQRKKNELEDDRQARIDARNSARFGTPPPKPSKIGRVSEFESMPTNWLGNVFKASGDYWGKALREGFLENPMLESAAHPQTAGDFAQLALAAPAMGTARAGTQLGEAVANSRLGKPIVNAASKVTKPIVQFGRKVLNTPIPGTPSKEQIWDATFGRGRIRELAQQNALNAQNPALQYGPKNAPLGLPPAPEDLYPSSNAGRARFVSGPAGTADVTQQYSVPMREGDPLIRDSKGRLASNPAYRRDQPISAIDAAQRGTLLKPTVANAPKYTEAQLADKSRAKFGLFNQLTQKDDPVALRNAIHDFGDNIAGDTASGFPKGDPKKIVIPETGMTEQDVSDLLKTRRNKLSGDMDITEDVTNPSRFTPDGDFISQTGREIPTGPTSGQSRIRGGKWRELTEEETNIIDQARRDVNNSIPVGTPEHRKALNDINRYQTQLELEGSPQITPPEKPPTARIDPFAKMHMDNPETEGIKLETDRQNYVRDQSHPTSVDAPSPIQSNAPETEYERLGKTRVDLEDRLQRERGQSHLPNREDTSEYQAALQKDIDAIKARQEAITEDPLTEDRLHVSHLGDEKERITRIAGSKVDAGGKAKDVTRELDALGRIRKQLDYFDSRNIKSGRIGTAEVNPNVNINEADYVGDLEDPPWHKPVPIQKGSPPDIARMKLADIDARRRQGTPLSQTTMGTQPPASPGPVQPNARSWQNRPPASTGNAGNISGTPGGPSVPPTGGQGNLFGGGGPVKPATWQETKDAVGQWARSVTRGAKDRAGLAADRFTDPVAFVQQREAEGIKAGLPANVIDDIKKSIPANVQGKDYIKAYEQAFQTKMRDKEFYDFLKGSGQLVKGDLNSSPRNWEFGGPNAQGGKFGREGINNWVENPFKHVNEYITGTGDVGSASKNITLSGGVPGTKYNAHGWNLGRNDASLRGYKPAFQRMFSDPTGKKAEAAMQSLTHADRELLIELHEKGGWQGNPNPDTGQHMNIFRKASDVLNPDKPLQRVGQMVLAGPEAAMDKYIKYFEDPLFRKSLPAWNTIDTLEKYHELAPQIGHDAAIKAAAKIGNDFKGGVDKILRDPTPQTLNRIAFIAPDWMESQLSKAKSQWQGAGRVVKGAITGTPASPVDKIYAKSLLRGAPLPSIGTAATLYAGKQLLTDKQRDIGAIPIGTDAVGKTRQIPTLTTATEEWRIPFDAPVLAITRRDPTILVDMLVKNRMNDMASMVVNIVRGEDDFGNPLKNKDKFGRPISVEKAIGNYAYELTKPFQPPLVQALGKYLTGKISAEEAAATGLELPVQYSKEPAPR